MAKEKDFYTLEEAAEYIGKGRATVYNYMRDLGIETVKFKRNKRAYLALADVRRIKEAVTGRLLIPDDTAKREAIKKAEKDAA